MNVRLKDGSSRRAHYERAARQGRRIQALHAAPSLPPGAETIWTAWQSLAAVRRWDGMAGLPEPIGYGAILDWTRAMRTPLHPKEFEAVIALDATYRAWDSEQRKRKPTEDED